jgi:poly(3-hydroxybutyrate) depolymerase
VYGGLAETSAARDADVFARVWPIAYRAHTGALRRAFVVLPRWYGPRRHPSIPLVISPHGRGVGARRNARMWWELVQSHDFAVVSPQGQGRRLEFFSWGDPGQIADLARMPRIVRRAIPWLRITPHRVYAFGGSMGGQETLLLLARYPHLLAGAAAFDAVTNMALRYHEFTPKLRRLARIEVGGTPMDASGMYAARSPLTEAARIAFSGVPLQLWWSVKDRIVVHERLESGRLYRTIERLNPRASVVEVVGRWPHTIEMRHGWGLRLALEKFGLLGPSRPKFLARGTEIDRATDAKRRMVNFVQRRLNMRAGHSGP